LNLLELPAKTGNRLLEVLAQFSPLDVHVGEEVEELLGQRRDHLSLTGFGQQAVERLVNLHWELSPAQRVVLIADLEDAVLPEAEIADDEHQLPCASESDVQSPFVGDVTQGVWSISKGRGAVEDNRDIFQALEGVDSLDHDPFGQELRFPEEFELVGIHGNNLYVVWANLLGQLVRQPAGDADAILIVGGV
jgi:hypothetical protein